LFILLHFVNSCCEFSTAIRNVTRLYENIEVHNDNLENFGYLASKFDLLFKPPVSATKEAELLTLAAQHLQSQFKVSIPTFDSLTKSCIISLKDNNTKSHSKYRSIDGRGNNLNNPDWGASETPFARFAPKSYDDGIYSIRKSVTGNELPNPRLLVQEVLMKAVRPKLPTLIPNIMSLVTVFFMHHELHLQDPVRPNDNNFAIRCCSKDRKHVLPPSLSHSSCIPIPISKDDSVFKGSIGCHNALRSQIGKSPSGFETGEILNRATSYFDLSMIYGDQESELRKIRLYQGGKLRLSKNNVFPVDSSGKLLNSMIRWNIVPIGCIWPGVFSKNHNQLAERLTQLNPSWNDETLFQEARRINIATWQSNIITGKFIKNILNSTISEKYSPDRKTSTFIEFSSSQRGVGHSHLPSYFSLLSENGTTRSYLQMDTVGRSDLVETAFDDALRGNLNNLVNTKQYTSELTDKAGVIAVDILRGRDHGIPSYLEIRRKCGLKSDIKTFDDFKLIFPKTPSNADLLKNMYESPEDVDFYIGGVLDTYENSFQPFVGPTFACVIKENYKNAVAGDIYFYSHSENPNPFTKQQIDAIDAFKVNNLLCTNSGLKEIPENWGFLAHPTLNPMMKCSSFPPIDLSAWKVKY
jgi:peroxidase